VTARLDREIAKINKAHVPAGTRSDWVARLRAIAACCKQPEQAAESGEFCGRCGYAYNDHDHWRAKLAKEQQP
jgi:hypothetical protein